MLLALFGLVAGQGVVWYRASSMLFFLTSVLKVDALAANIMIVVPVSIIGTPFFVVFGTLSDKIGRKPIIMAGLLLAVLTYQPLFKMLTEAANPALARRSGLRADQVDREHRHLLVPGSPIAREVDFTSPAISPSAPWPCRPASYETVHDASPRCRGLCG